MQLSAPAAERAAQAKSWPNNRLFLCALEGSEDEYFFFLLTNYKDYGLQLGDYGAVVLSWY